MPSPRQALARRRCLRCAEALGGDLHGAAVGSRQISGAEARVGDAVGFLLDPESTPELAIRQHDHAEDGVRAIDVAGAPVETRLVEAGCRGAVEAQGLAAGPGEGAGRLA